MEKGVDHLDTVPDGGKGHPQTNGKLERFGEIQLNLKHFVWNHQNSGGNLMVSAILRPILESIEADDCLRFIEWYDGIMSHMSLNGGKIPCPAFIRKMPESDVIDSQIGQRY